MEAEELGFDPARVLKEVRRELGERRRRSAPAPSQQLALYKREILALDAAGATSHEIKFYLRDNYGLVIVPGLIFSFIDEHKRGGAGLPDSFLKKFKPQEVLAGIRASRTSRYKGGSSLDPYKKEIIRLVAKGKSAGEIRDAIAKRYGLEMARGTVNSYVRKITTPKQ